VTELAGIPREPEGHRTYAWIMVRGVVSVGKLLITSARDVSRFRRSGPSEARYVRPPRRYDLPGYTEGLPTCYSNGRYLRPTRFCNPRAPEVIALANELGAHRLQCREYAERAFHFAKEMLTLEIAPIDSVEASLQRGTGTCFDLISVFIALCRAAGIPARYKIFATDMVQAWRETVIDVDPLLKKWYDALGYFLLEGEGEAYVDGKWMVAHVGPTAERQAAAGIPITRFGEDALGVWFRAKPGTIMRPEALPVGLAAGSKALHAISPASMERVNLSVSVQIDKGRRIIAEAGGVAAYDMQARRAREALSLVGSAP